MASLRIVVFGDSYVQRQGEFTNLQQQIKFIGDEDMTLLDLPSDKWDELIEYKPDVVLLHLGGSDIVEMPGSDQVTPLYNKMQDLVKQLRSTGARVLVGEILPRAEFGLLDVTLGTFEKVRRGLNRKLQRWLKDSFIFLHHHYNYDGVRLSSSGMTHYDKALRRIYVGLS